MSATLTDLNLKKPVKSPRPRGKKEKKRKRKEKGKNCNEKIEIEKITKAPKIK